MGAYFYEHVLSEHYQPTTTENIDATIDTIYNAFNIACSATMKKGNMPAFSAKWWNDEYQEAVACLQEATSTDNKQACRKTLCSTVAQMSDLNMLLC
jgi:hypothetical protein